LLKGALKKCVPDELQESRGLRSLCARKKMVASPLVLNTAAVARWTFCPTKPRRNLLRRGGCRRGPRTPPPQVIQRQGGNGAPRGTRTHDPLIKKAQTQKRPKWALWGQNRALDTFYVNVVLGLMRLKKAGFGPRVGTSTAQELALKSAVFATQPADSDALGHARPRSCHLCAKSLLNSDGQ
jgi:hypothetical protein